MDVRVGLWRKVSAKELMLLKCGVGEDSWESLGLQGDPTSPFWRRPVLSVHWKDWCWGWNSNTLATSCEELTHWKILWCWEGLGAGKEGDNRGWDGWMVSPTQWTWVWVNSGSWWWTGRPGVLQFMGLQRVGHDWTEPKEQAHKMLYTWFLIKVIFAGIESGIMLMFCCERFIDLCCLKEFITIMLKIFVCFVSFKFFFLFFLFQAFLRYN